MHGKGRVYVHGVLTGDTTMNLISAGLQAGASVGTNGANSSASVDSSNGGTDGAFFKGMAVFTIAKGGLMYAAPRRGD